MNENVPEEKIVITKSMMARGLESIGCILIMLGCFVPMYSAEFLGISMSISYIQGDGIIVCILAIMAMIIALYGKQLLSGIYFIVSAAVFIYTLYEVVSLGEFMHIEAGTILIILGYILAVCGIVAGIYWKSDRKGKKSNWVVAGVTVFGIVCCIAGTVFIDYMETEKNYKEAVNYIEEKEYDQAIELFSELGDYKDSAEKQKECNYLQAKDDLESGFYGDAIEAFQKLKDYEDSKELLKEAQFEDIKEDYSIFGDTSEEIHDIMQISDYEPGEEYCKQLIKEQLQDYYDNKAYDSIMEFLEKLEDVYDAKELKDYKLECKYQQAKYYYESEDYEDALETLKEAGNSDRVKALTKKIEKEIKELDEAKELIDTFWGWDEYDPTYEQEEDETEEEYICPYSSMEKLTKKQVLNLSKKERWIAKNEIYARHGRIFNNQELQDYFNSTSWYLGYIEPDDFDESVFSKIEKANVKLLAKYE